MNKEEIVYKLNELLRELNDEKLVFLLDEEGNETNLVLDNFMIKDNDNLMMLLAGVILFRMELVRIWNS